MGDGKQKMHNIFAKYFRDRIYKLMIKVALIKMIKVAFSNIQSNNRIYDPVSDPFTLYWGILPGVSTPNAVTHCSWGTSQFHW